MPVADRSCARMSYLAAVPVAPSLFVSTMYDASIFNVAVRRITDYVH
jgi:hypothetical protein